MKETKNWLKIATRQAQHELTFLRQQVNALDAFQSINHLSEITHQRRLISADIKNTRRVLRDERFKAVLRGDLPAEEYRPTPPQKIETAKVLSFEPTTNESEKRQLLLVS